MTPKSRFWRYRQGLPTVARALGCHDRDAEFYERQSTADQLHRAYPEGAPGWGFGAAALNVSQHALIAKNAPQPGQKVRVPIRFELSE